MGKQKAALTDAIAILLSVTPETPVGKLLKLCLEAKVEEKVADKTALQMAQEFVAKPEDLAYWMQDVIGADGEIKLKNGRLWRIRAYRYRGVFEFLLARIRKNRSQSSIESFPSEDKAAVRKKRDLVNRIEIFGTDSIYFLQIL